MDDLEIYAHRGHTKHGIPDNSLMSVFYACYMREGTYTGVELDVRWVPGRGLVAAHDWWNKWWAWDLPHLIQIAQINKKKVILDVKERHALKQVVELFLSDDVLVASEHWDLLRDHDIRITQERITDDPEYIYAVKYDRSEPEFLYSDKYIWGLNLKEAEELHYRSGRVWGLIVD